MLLFVSHYNIIILLCLVPFEKYYDIVEKDKQADATIVFNAEIAP